MATTTLATLPPVSTTRFESWYKRHFVALSLIVALLLVIYTYLSLTLENTFDWLFVAPIPVFLIGIRGAVELPERLRSTISRLANRGVIEVTPQQLDQLQDMLAARAIRWARRSSIAGAVVGAVVVIPFLVAYYRRDSITSLDGYISLIGAALHLQVWAIAPAAEAFLLPIEVVIGYFVGYYAGHVLANGRLGHFLEKRGVAIKIQPGYPDGAGGLVPVGSLYLFQALLVALPGVYFAVSLVLFRVLSGTPLDNNYARDFGLPYVYLFVVFVVVEILAFLAPLWSFHEQMLEQKRSLVAESDKIGQRIAAIQARLVQAEAPEEVRALAEQLSAATAQYRAVQQMPTWPVSIRAAGVFSLGNLGLVLSVVAQPVVAQWLSHR